MLSKLIPEKNYGGREMRKGEEEGEEVEEEDVERSKRGR